LSFLTETEAAQLAGISLRSLRRYRTRYGQRRIKNRIQNARGKGPKFLSLGKRVRYRPVDIRKWLATRAARKRRARIENLEILEAMLFDDHGRRPAARR